MEEKLCKGCNTIKNIDEFPFKINSRGKGYHSNYCRQCKKEKQSLYNSKNPIRTWCINTLSNHKTNGYIINITLDELDEYVRHTNYCYICGKELDWSTGKKHSKHNSPSLDRLNNDMFISKDNI